MEKISETDSPFDGLTLTPFGQHISGTVMSRVPD